jgi:hypothetical protein
MPVEPVHRIDSEGNILEGEDSEGVQELVEQFREFVKTDRSFHDKVYCPPPLFRFWGDVDLMLGDESVSVVCQGILETSSEFYLPNQ